MKSLQYHHLFFTYRIKTKEYFYAKGTQNSSNYSDNHLKRLLAVHQTQTLLPILWPNAKQSETITPNQRA